MKRLTIVKISDNPDIAHVYEHIFCYALEKYFIHNKLISYIDYFYNARTYHGGFIHITLHLYSKEAMALADRIAQLSPSFDEDDVNVALLEIMAEKQVEMSGDLEGIIALMKKLHKSPWLPIDEIGLLNIRAAQLNPGAIKLCDVSGDNFRVMKCTMILDADNIGLPFYYAQPLFHVISETISNNITDMLARDYAYFGYDSTSSYADFTASSVRKYRVYRKQIDSLTTEAKDCENVINTLLAHGLVGKASAYLQLATFSVPLAAPDELAFYERSELLVGGRGWRDIATIENIEKVLRSMNISLSMGHDHKVVKMA